MQLNGNLELNALGQSEIQNMVIERVASLPAFVASEAGRVVYNTKESTLFKNNGTQWISLATGGDAALLENEVDAVEAAVGLAGNGSFIPWTSSNYINTASTHKEGASLLDAQLKSEETARLANDESLQNSLNSEAATRLSEDNKIRQSLADEADLRTAADATLQANLDTESAAREAADNVLQSNLDAESTRAKNAETTLNTAILTEKGRAESAESNLQNIIATETANRIAGDEAVQSDLDSTKESYGIFVANQAELDQSQDIEISKKVAKSGDNMSGNLAMNGNTITGIKIPENSADAANKEYVDQAISGLNWKDPVRLANFIDNQKNTPPASPKFGDAYILSGAGTGDWSSYASGNIVQFNGNQWVLVEAAISAGDRLIVAGNTDTLPGSAFKSNSIIVWNGTSFDEILPRENITVYVDDKESVNFGQSFVYKEQNQKWTQISGPSQIAAGVGLAYQGNTMHINLGAGVTEKPNDEVGLDIYPSSGLFTTSDGINGSGLTGASLSIQRDGDTLTTSVNGIRVSQDILDDIAANAVSLSNEKLRAEGAEDDLLAAINSEKNRAISEETDLQSNIDSEASTRSAADSALQASLNAEISRAKTKENELQNNINAETQSRESAITALQQDVVAKNNAIHAKVDKMHFLYASSAPNTSHTINHNLGTQFVVSTVYLTETGEQIIPESVIANDPNKLTVTFNIAINCRVVVMGLA